MILSFKDFELDTAALEVRRGGRRVSVEPKVFDLLVLLAANHDRVVSKDEVIEELWLGRAISDAAVSTCVKAARKAIGDSGHTQSLIRTVPRRGYRFVGNVTAADPSASVEPVPSSPSATGVDDAHDLRLPDQPSIAVLPFEALNPEGDRFTLANGLARDITSRLGRGRSLFVIARGSSFQFAPSDAQRIGSRLAVRYALQGSVQSRGTKIRVNAALIDTVERREIWADVFNRNVDDIFAVQDEITEAIAHRVQTEVELSERRRALLKPITNLDAWSAYHRACWHMDRHTLNDYERAEEYFKIAADLDQSTARIFAGLSAVHRQRAFLNLTNDPGDDARQALEFARHSLSLDPIDPQGHWALGRALMLRHEVLPAISAFEKATELNPSFAMSQYSVGFGRAMVGSNARSDDAIKTAERLSPIDPMRFAMVATQAFNAASKADYESAADLAKLAAGQPNAHYHIVALAALCNALAQQPLETDHYLKHLRSIQPNYTSAEFFEAFPFQGDEHVAMWRKGFQLVGLGP